MKVIIWLVNSHLRLLDGKCINNRKRGRSGKGAELIVYCFRKRHLWGSKVHAGFSIPLRFYLGWSAFWDDVKKIVSGLIILYDRRGGFLGGALEWFQRSYIIVMPRLLCNYVFFTSTENRRTRSLSSTDAAIASNVLPSICANTVYFRIDWTVCIVPRNHRTHTLKQMFITWNSHHLNKC